jgi:hypothetical protein
LQKLLFDKQWRIAMLDLIYSAIANTSSFLKNLRLERLLPVVLVGWLLITTNVAQGQSSQSLGERMRDRVEEIDRNSERPKTTGELQEEAREGVPLGERIRNITRDSKEAFGLFGKEYSIGAQESARNVKDKAAQTAEDATQGVRRAANRVSD